MRDTLQCLEKWYEVLTKDLKIFQFKMEENGDQYFKWGSSYENIDNTKRCLLQILLGPFSTHFSLIL